METVAVKVFQVGDVAYRRGAARVNGELQYYFAPHTVLKIRKKTIYGFRQNAYTLQGCGYEYAACDLLNDDEVVAERLKGLEVKKIS